MKHIAFRQLWVCQNNHFRWAYFTVETGYAKGDTTLKLEWGKKNCECPTGDFGEGFVPHSDLQIYTGMRDKDGSKVYIGDYLKESDKVYEVMWNPAGFIELQDKTSGEFIINWAPSSFIPLGTICGNILENPEFKHYGKRIVN